MNQHQISKFYLKLFLDKSLKKNRPIWLYHSSQGVWERAVGLDKLFSRENYYQMEPIIEGLDANILESFYSKTETWASNLYKRKILNERNITPMEMVWLLLFSTSFSTKLNFIDLDDDK